ncbi:transposase [bacterium]|nr:transposase [bacterium]
MIPRVFKLTMAVRSKASTAEKKVKKRKRHIGVDIEGHLMDVIVTPANVHDTNAGVALLDNLKLKCPSIQAFSGDSAYQGDSSLFAEILLETPIQITHKAKEGFTVLTKRWIVERTFSWLGHDRRLAKNYEIQPRHSENMVRISMVRRTLRRVMKNS